MNDAKNVLELFAGEWAGDEEIAPSKWGEGGSARASITARVDFDGGMMVHDYRAQREGKPWLKVHAVITYDGQSSSFGLFWFDSLGYTPAEPAAGTWDGTSLCFVRSSPRGQARHIVHSIQVQAGCRL